MVAEQACDIFLFFIFLYKFLYRLALSDSRILAFENVLKGEIHYSFVRRGILVDHDYGDRCMRCVYTKWFVGLVLFLYQR